MRAAANAMSNQRPGLGTIHTLYTIYSDTEIHPGGFMLGRTDYSATQRRRATIFRPATAAAYLTYDRHISERQSLNTIFTRVNPSIRINCVQRAVVPKDLHPLKGSKSMQKQCSPRCTIISELDTDWNCL